MTREKLFYSTAWISMLLVGASWGTLLLLQLRDVNAFTGLNLFEINAHGGAQIYGWIGCAIIGSAYLALPRLLKTPLPYPRLSLSIWTLLLVGILFSIAGLFTSSPSLTMMGGGATLLSVLLFAVQLCTLFSRSTFSGPPLLYLLTALLFFALSTGYSLWHHLALVQAPTRELLLAQVATFQAPLRDLQVHGTALFMVFGMVQLFFLRPTPRASLIAWSLLLFGVVGEVTLFLLYRALQSHLFAAALILPWGALLAGSLLFLISARAYTHSPLFARIAISWLLLSEVMLLLLPLYSALTHIPFSHAYYGAIRHAVTVGFLSQMIFGMAPALLSRFSLVPLPPLRGALVLLNLGCFARVSLQICTDFFPSCFSLIPLSGALELSATCLWGIPLLSLLLNSRPLAPTRLDITR